jgi:alcohol dehydrogenase class IV
MGVASPTTSDADNAHRAIGAVEALRARVGTDKRGRDIGIEPEMIPRLVEDAFADPLMAATPRYPEPADVTRLYQDSL